MTSRVGRWVAGLGALATAAVAVPIASAAPSIPDGVRAEMQQMLEALRTEGTAPGASITFGDGEHDVTLSSGTRNVLMPRPIGSTDRVRVGSATKMFVAATVLQLVGDGRLALDAPIDRYLPGVLRYPDGKVPGDPAAYDGRAVTVRQLLQHTGGVPDYADLTYVLDPTHQLVAPTPTTHLAHALPNGPTFRPGTSWGYSNTGYALLGMAVESVTGRSLGAEIARRIIEPLRLTRTFYAAAGQKQIPGLHVRGYLASTAPVDMTNFEPNVWGAAGALVSSPDDMNTFLSSLLAGEVVPRALLAQMQDVVPMAGADTGYGLGLVRVTLSCGDAWGHAGALAGYRTFALALPNGRHAFYTLNSAAAIPLLPPTSITDPYDLVEAALC